MPLASRVSVSCFTVTPSFTATPPADSIVVPDDFSTIQEAIDNAPEGGTVFVRSGSYRERVLVNKPLSLIGEDPENTDISISGLPYLSYAAIEVLSEDVTIAGFTIRDTYTGIFIKEEYKNPPPSRCKIIGNNIIDNFRWGIFLRPPDETKNHIISGNYIAGNGEYGIYASSSNSVISGNNITGNGLGGIIVDSCSNVTISGNSISSNGEGGLRLSWYGPFYVYGNNITDNQGFGIQFDGCSESIIYQNNILRNSIGVKLLDHRVTEEETAWGNIVYRNNIVDNSQQALVDPENSNRTGVISWDNGTVGNHWSDYQTRYPSAAEVGTSGIGDTPYVIDENNTDHHPLMQAVDISLTPPPISQPSSDSQLIIAAIVVVVVAVILAGVLLVYRKGFQHAPLHPQP